MASVTAVLPVPANANAAPSTAAKPADDDFHAVLASYAPAQDHAAARSAAKNDASAPRATSKREAKSDPIVRDGGSKDSKKAARDSKPSAKDAQADIQPQTTVAVAQHAAPIILRDTIAVQAPVAANSDDAVESDTDASFKTQAIASAIDIPAATATAPASPASVLPSAGQLGADDTRNPATKSQDLHTRDSASRQAQSAAIQNAPAKALPQRAADAIAAAVKNGPQPQTPAVTAASTEQAPPAPRGMQPLQSSIVAMLNAMRGAITTTLAPKQTVVPTSDTKPDSKPDVKQDAKSDLKLDAKSDLKLDVKPAPWLDVEPDAKSDLKLDAKSDLKLDVKSDPMPNMESDAKSDLKLDAKSDLKLDVKSDPMPDMEPDAKSGMNAGANSGKATPKSVSDTAGASFKSNAPMKSVDLARATDPAPDDVKSDNTQPVTATAANANKPATAAATVKPEADAAPAQPDPHTRTHDDHVAAAASSDSDKAAPSPVTTQPATTTSPPSGTIGTVVAPAVAASSASAKGVTPAPSTHVPQDSAAQPNLAALATAIAVKSASGTKTFDIRLDPPELGRVDVHLSVDRDGKVQATLSADRPQTVELLQRDSQSLERALKDSGLNLSNNSLNFSLKGEGRQGDGGGASRAHTRSLPDVVVARAEAANASVSNFNFASGNGRLDIRV